MAYNIIVSILQVGNWGNQSVRELAIVTQLGSGGGRFWIQAARLQRVYYCQWDHESQLSGHLHWDISPDALQLKKACPPLGFYKILFLNSIQYTSVGSVHACRWYPHELWEGSLKEGHRLPVRAGAVSGAGHTACSVIGEWVGKWIYLEVGPFSSSLHLCISEKGRSVPRTSEILFECWNSLKCTENLSCAMSCFRHRVRAMKMTDVSLTQRLRSSY